MDSKYFVLQSRSEVAVAYQLNRILPKRAERSGRDQGLPVRVRDFPSDVLATALSSSVQ